MNQSLTTNLQNINASYTIELDPDIQNHDVGFKLPPEEIKPVGESFYTFNTFNICVNAKHLGQFSKYNIVTGNL